jgi:hypothetical protein
MALAHLHAGLEAIDLRAGHLPGMIVLVAGQRRAPALDRIGDEHRRLVGGRLALELLEQALDAMAAEIRHQFRQFSVAAAFEQRRHVALIADLVGSRSRQAAPPRNISAE